MAFAQGSATAGWLRLNHAPSTQATLFAIGYTRFALRVTPIDAEFNVADELGLQGANSGPNSGGMASISISGFSG